MVDYVQIGALNASSDEGFMWKNETGKLVNISWAYPSMLAAPFAPLPTVVANNSIAIFSTTSSQFERNFRDRFPFAVDIPQSDQKRTFYYSFPAAPPPPLPPAPECYETTKRISPTNPNVIQKCIYGKWTDFLTCEYGANTATLECNPAPPSPTPTPSPTPLPVSDPMRAWNDWANSFPDIENALTDAQKIFIATFITSGPASLVGGFITWLKGAGLVGGAAAGASATSIWNYLTLAKTGAETALLVMGTKTFIDFILEESIQTSGMGLYILITNKKWKEAREMIKTSWKIQELLQQSIDSYGFLSPFSASAFKAFSEATKAQLVAYEEIIASNIPAEYALSESFTALARTITDGDTVKFKLGSDTLNVRLVGINTPEKGEPNYAASKRFLFNRIWGKTVTIKVDPEHQWDKFSRALGTIFLDGVNINKLMIEKGWAFFYPYEPNLYVVPNEYELAEQSAKLKKNGIWGLAMAEGANKEISLTFLKTLLVGKFASEAEVREYLLNMGYSPKESNWIFDVWGFKAPAVSRPEKTGIKISSSPTYANIFIDGVDQYVITPEMIEMPAGTHVVTLKLGGYKDETRNVPVAENNTTEIHLKLESVF